MGRPAQPLHLDPAVREVCLEHLRFCRDAGIELIVTSTWRDYQAQDALYAIGRTVDKGKRCVTNAKALETQELIRVFKPEPDDPRYPRTGSGRIPTIIFPVQEKKL